MSDEDATRELGTMSPMRRRKTADPTARAQRLRPARGTKTQPIPSPPADQGDAQVVGIGASAGGLEALKGFFGAMPRESGLAFVVVHLNPTHESLMPELLAKCTGRRRDRRDMDVAPPASAEIADGLNRHGS